MCQVVCYYQKGTVVHKLLPYGSKVITSRRYDFHILLSKYNELERGGPREMKLKTWTFVNQAETEARIKAEQLAEAEEFEAKL